MPPAIPDLVTPALDGLRERLGAGGAGLRLEVVGVAPVKYERNAPADPLDRPGRGRWSSRAELTVLVSGTDGDTPTVASTEVVGSLLQLQIRGVDRVSGMDGFGLWTALGRVPQAGFLVRLPVVAEGDHPERPVILEPLDIVAGDLAHWSPDPAAAKSESGRSDSSISHPRNSDRSN